MPNVTTSVTPSKFLSINDSISSTPYSKYNKNTIIDTNHLSSTLLPTPENNASPITLSCMDNAKTRNTNNNINVNKDIYPKDDIVIKFYKQGLPQDNLYDSSLTKTAAILVNLFSELPLIYEYDRARKQFKKDQMFYKNMYKWFAAKIEVKLTNLYDDLKSKLKKLENKRLLENSNLSLIPVNKTDKKVYKDTIHKLKLILKLKCEFQF